MKIKVCCSECGKSFIISDKGNNIFEPSVCPVCNSKIVSIRNSDTSNVKTAWAKKV